jgi:hypothetical protein
MEAHLKESLKLHRAQVDVLKNISKSIKKGIAE